MYRKGSDYDKLDRMVIEIYVDYGIHKFPLNLQDLSEKAGVKLIAYSEFDEITKALLMKKSNDGFYSPATILSPHVIFYNDEIGSEGRKRYNISHELKHYFNNDTDESEFGEDMADHFGKYLLCPTPCLVVNGKLDPLSIVADYGLSFEAAENASNAARNRIKKYNRRIFEYEQPLIRLIFGEDFDIKAFERGETDVVIGKKSL
ncbi:MAG: ImmA/IrrE family metallo-endopeptidase [Bulleidia sp.]|nr:ImmA/IrrE family metallo-endopeptidase [Bulleidia sp.]